MTPTEKAVELWNGMTPMERYQVMCKVPHHNSMTKKFRACIKYLRDEMDAPRERWVVAYVCGNGNIAYSSQSPVFDNEQSAQWDAERRHEQKPHLKFVPHKLED